MTWPSYPDCKESGVEAIGMIPSHWATPHLGHISACLDYLRIPLNSVERADMPGEVPYWGANGVVDTVDRSLVDGPLVLLGEDGAPFFDRNKDKAFFVDSPIWPNNHIHVLQPKHSVSGRFLAHALNATDYAAWIEGSTRDKLTQGNMTSIPVPLPPRGEQDAIVAFLGEETAKIDALIAKQEQLIATLREDRTATITHAVTNGLDPDAEMCESGVEVLGDIPADWSCARLKMMLTEPMSYGANAAADDDTPGHPRYVRITDIASDGSLRPDTFRSLPPDVAAPYLLAEGDLLFARSGATVGKTFLYKASWGTCCYAGYLIKARVDRAIADPAYVNYYTATSAYWHHVFSEQIQATIQNVSAERFGGLPVPVPPLNTQQQVVSHLDRQCAKLDALIAKSNEVIETLREYRSALITDAVTGKIDVRGVA